MKKLDERVATLEKDMTVLEKYVKQWTEGAETYLLALRRVAEEKLQIDFSSYLQAAEAQPAHDTDDINPADTQ